jgi:alginate O-acetyltransferase complex protein AlgJ
MATRTLFTDPPRAAISRAPALGATRRRQDLLLSLAFLLFIALPGLALVLPIDPPIAHTDNRELTPYPKLEPHWASISSFGSRFQRYFEDNFGFRARLIRAHALLEARLLGVSPLSTVLWGREGWLYYADDGGTEDIISATPFSAAELEVWRKTLVDNRDWLRMRGIEYVFAIAPDKHEIYPEYLPPSIHRLGREARMDQLTTYLRANTDLVLVDLKGALLEAKQRERVYDRTDSHWNRRGAYVGYRALMDAVAARVPGVAPPLPLTEFRPTKAITPGMDLAGMLRLRDVFPEESLSLDPLRPRQARVIEPPEGSPNGNEGYIVSEIAGSRAPRAVVFRDSYTSRLYPYLSEHFSHAAYYWQNDLDPDDVLRHRPAVVIHEIASRHLTFLVPYNAVAGR